MRRGQSTVEYLLAVSVISVAIALALAVLWSAFTEGTDELAGDMATSLTTGGLQR